MLLLRLHEIRYCCHTVQAFLSHGHACSTCVQLYSWCTDWQICMHCWIHMCVSMCMHVCTRKCVCTMPCMCVCMCVCPSVPLPLSQCPICNPYHTHIPLITCIIAHPPALIRGAPAEASTYNECLCPGVPTPIAHAPWPVGSVAGYSV